MNLIFCSFLSHVRVAAIYYLLDLFQITDLLRIVLLNMSLTECASKAARLHSYLRERGRLKIGVSLFKIVSPQEFSSCKSCRCGILFLENLGQDPHGTGRRLQRKQETKADLRSQ